MSAIIIFLSLVCAFLSNQSIDKNRGSTMEKQDRVVTIAVLQAGKDHSKNGNPGLETNFALFEQLAREAASAAPDLIVFPEYAITGWPYPPENVMNGIAEQIPGDGPWYSRYANLARETRTADSL